MVGGRGEPHHINNHSALMANSGNTLGRYVKYGGALDGFLSLTSFQKQNPDINDELSTMKWTVTYEFILYKHITYIHMVNSCNEWLVNDNVT